MGNPFRFLRRRRRGDADFSEEIRAHLALEADRLVAEGFAPAEAAYEARRRFGNVGQAQEAFHHRRTIGWVEAFPRQLRRAARRLARSPVVSVTAILTLMLGIGGTTAVFSLVNGVLLRPLPFLHPAELVDLSHTMVLTGVSQVDQSDATYLYYRQANHVFSGVGAYRTVSVNLADDAGSGPGHAERTRAAHATASLFGVLGVAPLRGRVFQDAEDAGRTPVVIVGEQLWRDRYASDPGILGRSILIDGVPRQVIGVMPRRFGVPGERTALWLPAGIDPARTESANFDFRAVARLRAGVTPEAAEADLQPLLPKVPEAYPGRLTAPAIRVTHMRPVVRPLRDTVVGGVGPMLWIVFGAGAFLLLVACANVAGLFLVRAEERHHELAVRRALGAGRGVVMAEFLAEGLLLATIGGVLGLAFAGAGLGVLRSLESGIAIPRLEGVGLDGLVAAVTAGITLLTALLMSVVPALRAFGSPVAGVLVQNGRAATAGPNRQRARSVLVVVQVALALVLVTGAGLMARSFRSLRSVPPGFDAADSYTFRVALPGAAYPGAVATVGFVTRVLEGISAAPGFQAAGVVTKLPLDDAERRDTALFVEDHPLAMGKMPNVHQVSYASPDAFRALGIPFREGHTFQPPDPARAVQEVVVTHALARRYWGDAPAVGRRFRLAPAGAWFTVIGVTGDVRGTRLDQPPDETVYLPLVTAPGNAMADGGPGAARWTPRELAFVVRSSGTPGEVTGAVERTIRTAAPALPLYGLRPMREVVERSTARTSITLELLEIASLAALLIGAVGLYGVVSWTVSQRRREMAVRIALGAQPAALRRLVVRQAVELTGVGVALGLGAAALLMRYLSALLFGVTPTDPATLLGAVALMAGIAVAASWIPAHRAATIDPATALRADV